MKLLIPPRRELRERELNASGSIYFRPQPRLDYARITGHNASQWIDARIIFRMQ